MHQNDVRSTERIEASIDGRGPMPIATTDDRGEFEIRGLDPKMRYRVIAGGRGFCTPQSFAFDLHAGTSNAPIVLTAYPVYGLAIQVREEEGRLPQLGSDLGGKWWGTPSPLAQGARVVMSGDWTAALLGVRHPKARSSFDRVNYFICAMDEGDSIDVHFEIHYPGYEPVSARLPAWRAIERLRGEEVRIVPSGAGFGALTVWLEPVEDVPVALPEHASRSPSTLFLTEVDGEQREIRIGLSELHRGYQKIQGVPFGVYAARFRAPHQLYRFPPSTEAPEIVTVSEVEAALRVPLIDLGSLEIELQDAAGARFCGAVSGSHVRAVGRETDAFFFDSPPYLIPLLPSGAYSISVFASGAVLEADFDISAGVRTHLRVPMN